MSQNFAPGSLPTDRIIAALSKTTIDEIFVDRTRAAFARESADQLPCSASRAALSMTRPWFAISTNNELLKSMNSLNNFVLIVLL